MEKLSPAQMLLKELKKKGLNIAEDAVKDVVEAVFDALPAFLMATETKIDDVAIAILPIIKPYVINALDSLDGEVDEAK